LTFNQGSFQAFGDRRLREFTLGPALEGSLDATLAAAGIPLFALDLRTAPATGPAAEWLASEHPTRNVMSGYVENAPETITFNHAVTKRYDGLLFVEKTTAVHPNRPASPSGSK
jgi:erythromycin esterase